jgi:hypothetical protein
MVVFSLSYKHFEPQLQKEGLAAAAVGNALEWFDSTL